MTIPCIVVECKEGFSDGQPEKARYLTSTGFSTVDCGLRLILANITSVQGSFPRVLLLRMCGLMMVVLWLWLWLLRIRASTFSKG